MKDEPPAPGRDIEHPRVRQKLVEVRADVFRPRAVRSAEVDEEEARSISRDSAPSDMGLKSSTCLPQDLLRTIGGLVPECDPSTMSSQSPAA